MWIEDYTVLFKKQKGMMYGMLLGLVREKTNFRGDLRPFIKDLTPGNIGWLSPGASGRRRDPGDHLSLLI